MTTPAVTPGRHRAPAAADAEHRTEPHHEPRAQHRTESHREPRSQRRTEPRAEHRTGAPGAPEVRARRNGGPLGLLALQVLTEVRASLRNPEFAVGAVIIPVILYAMFGLTNASDLLPGGTRIGLAMMASLTCYGIVTLAIVVFGEDVAKDRGRGWLRTLRATPFPTSAYLGGKVGAALVHGGLITVTMSVLAASGWRRRSGRRSAPSCWPASWCSARSASRSRTSPGRRQRR